MTDDELKRLFDATREENAAFRQEMREGNAAMCEENAAFRQEMREGNAAMREENAAFRQEMREGNAATREENAAFRQEMREGNAAIRQENAAAHAETRRHFTVALEAADHRIQLVAEAVELTREELAREAARLDEKIDRTAAETQAMIRFSHVELYRRTQALEESQRTLEERLADLQERVERLESTTH